jgi:hypothetical protein
MQRRMTNAGVYMTEKAAEYYMHGVRRVYENASLGESTMMM